MKEIYDKIKIAFEESDIKMLPNPPFHINLAQYNFWSNNWGVLQIADAVGLGKTIEVGIFLSEMIKSRMQ